MENFNLKNENFKEDLISLISKCELPLANIYYIFKDVFRNIENSYMSVINQELAKEAKIETITLEEDEKQSEE